jgi:hypothetical protein
MLPVFECFFFYQPIYSDYEIAYDISQLNLLFEHRNDPDLVQAFPKKWWVESDFKAPNLPLSLRLNVLEWGRYVNLSNVIL